MGIPPSQAAQLRELLGDEGSRSPAKRAMQAAISRTVTTGRALIARDIVKAVRLKVSEVKDLITVKRGGYTKPEGSITITRRAKSLIDYLSPAQRERLGKARPRGGLKVSVRKRASGKYGVRETLPKGFVARGKGGNVHVFERVGRKRLPVRKLRGPTAIGVFAHAKGETAATIVRDVELELEKVLEKNLMSQVDRFLMRRKSDRPSEGL